MVGGKVTARMRFCEDFGRDIDELVCRCNWREVERKIVRHRSANCSAIQGKGEMGRANRSKEGGRVAISIWREGNGSRILIANVGTDDQKDHPSNRTKRDDVGVGHGTTLLYSLKVCCVR